VNPWSRGLSLSLVLALTAATAAPRAGQDPELERGVVLAQQGDFGLAVPVLDEAVRRLAAEGGAKERLVRALVYLAIAHQGLNQEQQARAQLEKALKVQPGLRLSLSEFPPKVVQFFDRVRKQATAAGTPPPSTPAPSAAPASSIGAAALMFERVDFFRTADEDEKPLDARLTLDPQSRAIVIADEKEGRAKALYARIPFEAVTDLIHQVSRSRPWTTGRPTKGKDHWLTIGFENSSGSVHLHLDKRNYREVLSALESATGLMTTTQIAR
jgi:tetratricopeptide (TPR) repeat protein